MGGDPRGGVSVGGSRREPDPRAAAHRSLCLPPPPDDNLSGTSGMEVDDRISYLEQRLQLQEDEIQVLKAALADVLRRLSACEENGLSLQRKGPTKGTGLLPPGGSAHTLGALFPESPSRFPWIQSPALPSLFQAGSAPSPPLEAIPAVGNIRQPLPHVFGSD